MNETVTLRQATAADIKSLARLWVTTFPDKFGPILGDNAERVICDWLRLSERHLPTTTIAEINGVVVGYIVLDTPSAPRPDNGRWLWRALQLHNGAFGALRSFISMILININRRSLKNEIYIEMLGIAPAWRGEGLAGQLLDYAETVARHANAVQLTLNVVSDNTAAINLYKKMGFEITLKQQSRALKWITGHNGYYEMTKKLEMRIEK